MTTERKRWWRLAAIAVVGGVAVTGGYRLVRATPAAESREAEQAWTSAATTEGPPTALPTVAEVERTPHAAPPATSSVTPVSATLPIPSPDSGNVAAPPVPVAPVVEPSIPVPPVSAPPVPVPVLPASAPTVPPISTLPEIEPVKAPRLPDVGATPADKIAIPAVPNATVIPVADLPTVPLPKPPVTAAPLAPPMPTTPSAPGGTPPTLPLLPSLPGTSSEPPKSLQLNPPTPVTPVVPQPSGTTPTAPPVKPPASTQPMLPAKSDSGLNLPNPGNTLNPTVPPLQPITPIVPDRGTPGTVVDRLKPPEPNLNATDKFVFPVPVVPTSTDPHRDDPMFKLTTTAAFAVLTGALLSAEKANAFPAVPPLTSVIPMPGGMVKDDKQEIESLKSQLADAKKRIAELEKQANLEKQIQTLTDLLNGKKEPFDAGAIAKIADLSGKLDSLLREMNKSQTSMKPAVAPEIKSTGIVKVINEYPVEISIVVNNTSHRVAPNKTLDVEVPAGDFNYQLLTAGAPLTNSKIGKGEIVRLRIK